MSDTWSPQEIATWIKKHYLSLRGGTVLGPVTFLDDVASTYLDNRYWRQWTRVLVVDDHALVRRGVATLLAREPDLEVVGEADNGQRAIELTRQLTPDVILMDVSLPGMNGIDATRAIHAEFPALRVIGLSMFENLEQPAAMREAGAVRYLSKSDSAEALLAAIRGGGESGRTRPGTTILGGQIVLRTPEAS